MKTQFINNLQYEPSQGLGGLNFDNGNSISYDDMVGAAGLSSGGFDFQDGLNTGGAVAAASLGLPPQIGSAVTSFLGSIFGSHDLPVADGWDAQDRDAGRTQGSTARGYVLDNGDDIAGEAKGVATYIQKRGINIMLTGNPWGGLIRNNDPKKEIGKDGQSWADTTVPQIADKFRRGGMGTEAAKLLSLVQQSGSYSQSAMPNNLAMQTGNYNPAIQALGGTANPSSSGVTGAPNSNKVWLIVGIVAGVLLLIGGVVWAVKSSVKK